MKINKVFDIILNITDITHIFVKKIDDKLIELLSEKYLNKCFMSSYILKINKIINRSLLEANQNDLECSFNISIQFEAECLIFNQNEIILDMEIQEIVNNNIITKKDNILALIKNNQDLTNFKKGDKIPITVGKVKYSVGSDKISINSYPFIPITTNIKYYKLSKLDDSELDLLNEEILNIIQLEENIKSTILKTKNNNWNYFKELIYPYKKNIELKNIKNTIDLLELVNNLEKYENQIIEINDKYNISDRTVILHKENEVNNYIKSNMYLIIYDILKKYYLNLKLINDLSTIYNTEKLIKENLTIFNIYSKYKK